MIFTLFLLLFIIIIFVDDRRFQINLYNNYEKYFKDWGETQYDNGAIYMNRLEMLKKDSYLKESVNFGEWSGYLAKVPRDIAENLALDGDLSRRTIKILYNHKCSTKKGFLNTTSQTDYHIVSDTKCLLCYKEVPDQIKIFMELTLLNYIKDNVWK